MSIGLSRACSGGYFEIYGYHDCRESQGAQLTVRKC